MKSLLLLLVSSLVIVTSLTGCLMTRTDVEETENKRKMQDQVSHLQKNNADQQVLFNEVNADMRELGGRVEVLENRIRTQDNDRQKSNLSLEQQLAEANKKILLLQEEMTKMEAQMTAMNAALQAQLASGGSMPPAGTAGAAAAATSGNHAVDPKANTFDTAEDFYEKKDYQNAILWYQKYREKFPKGKKVPDSLFKMGESFRALNMKDDARSFYNELVQRFPNSSQAKLAKARIAKLK